MDTGKDILQKISKLDTGKKILLGISLVMMVAGIAAAPGYYVYCKYFSGKQVGKFQMSERSNSFQVPGLTLKFGGSGAPKPFSVDLDPKMGLVGFNWSGQVSRVFGASTIGNSSLRNTYRATLYLGDRRVVQEAFSVSMDADKNSGETHYLSIASIPIMTAGKYHFVLEDSGTPQLTVTGIQVEVRRNVLEPSMKIVLSGVVLIAVGIIAFFRSAASSDDAESKA